MKSTRALAAFVSALALCPGQLQAQSKKDIALLEAVNDAEPAPADTEIAASLVTELEEQKPGEQAGCAPKSFTISGVSPATADRIIWFGVRDKEIRNAWQFDARSTDCPDFSRHAIVIRLKDGTLRSIVLYQGQSHAGLSVGRDASESVVLAIAIALSQEDVDLEKCLNQLSPGRREIVKEKALRPDYYGVHRGGEWREIWHFEACGYAVAQPIDFKANSKGGVDYKVSPVRATKIQVESY